MNNTAVATDQEIKEMKHKCWSTGCKRYAFLQEGMGWKYCIKHWWSNYRWGGGEVSFRALIRYIKWTTIF